MPHVCDLLLVANTAGRFVGLAGPKLLNPCLFRQPSRDSSTAVICSEEAPLSK
jgi:hypothetical protein